MSSARRGLGGRLWRFALKELRETLRDRRTVGTLVLMPLLVYPLLGLTFQKFFLSQAALTAPTEYHVAFDSRRAAMDFRDAFSTGNQLLGREASPGKPVPLLSGEPPEPSLNFLIPDLETMRVDLDEMVQTHQADLAIREIAGEGPNQRRFEFITQKDSALGRDAQEFVISRLRAVNEQFVAEYLRVQPMPVAVPFAWQPKALDGTGQTGFSLATLVPLVLILMTVTGAVYPAIDLTAGERERGTLEALIAAPIARHEVLLAKYVAVVTVAILTALVNVTAMIATAYGTGLERILFGSGGLSLILIGQLLGLLSVFAGFFSAVILAITSIARSFKEAQAYLIPVMLLSLSPGVLALMPGLELTLPLALTPLVNMVVLTRDLLDGRALWLPSLVVLISSMSYAGIALFIAARIFGTDAVLYGSSGTWSELWKRPETSSRRATVSLGLIGLGVLFPAYILLGSLPSRLGDVGLITRLMVSAGLTVVLFAVWPMWLCRYARVHLTTGLGLTRPALLSTIGAALAGTALWPFAYELEILTTPAERLRVMVELFRGFEQELQRIPTWFKLFALAATPAICEELFFRGFLFRTFEQRLSPLMNIIITATLFGLFHVLVRDTLLFERFIPTALMGLALGWVAHRSGSTLPGMLLHVIHNGSLLLLPDLSPWLGEWTRSTERSHLPGPLLIGAAIVVLIAIGILIAGTQTSRSDEHDKSAL
jgi:sodium transport system permease protein